MLHWLLAAAFHCKLIRYEFLLPRFLCFLIWTNIVRIRIDSIEPYLCEFLSLLSFLPYATTWHWYVLDLNLGAVIVLLNADVILGKYLQIEVTFMHEAFSGLVRQDSVQWELVKSAWVVAYISVCKVPFEQVYPQIRILSHADLELIVEARMWTLPVRLLIDHRVAHTNDLGACVSDLLLCFVWSFQHWVHTQRARLLLNHIVWRST